MCTKEFFMRIYCTVTNDLRYDQRMIRICSSLQAAGHQVCLIGRRLPWSEELPERSFAQKRLYCFFRKGKLFYIEYNIRLFLFLLFSSCHCICAVDLDTILPGLWAARLRGRKLVYDAHEYFSELPELQNRPRTKAIWERIGKYAIPKVDAAYTVCASLAHIFEARYAKPFAVLRNLPFRAKEEPQAPPPSKTCILLYQGVLNEGRGLETALETLAQLPAEFVLWLVGEGDKSQELRSLAQKYQLAEPRLRFWGYRSPEELKEITRQAHIGLNLLENKGLNYYYSLANKFFDYVQAHRPSINMAFPEYQRHLAQYAVGLAIEELSAEALKKALLFVQKPENYQRLCEETTRAAKDWVWEQEEQNLLDIYQKLEEELHKSK